jgi:uncharacterized protein
VIGEFLRVATHPRVLVPPSSEAAALGAIEALLESPSVRVLSPGTRYWPLLSGLITDARARGNLVMDAQIAAVCLEHGATTILTEDRDFSRFDGIRVRRLSAGPERA